MTHKVHPIALRLGGVASWRSNWFSRKKFREYLEQDFYIRTYIADHVDRLSLNRVEIERSGNELNVILYSSRPGLIIGRGGAGAEELRVNLEKTIRKHTKDFHKVRVEIQEVKKPETHARLVALGIAEQLERRVPFRRVLKKTIERIMSAKEVRGVKIMVSGRLDGSEMARREWLGKGELPLQNLRANIDYAHVLARTTYGVIGVKAWIYKGEVFEDA